jgi:hypothetical protein
VCGVARLLVNANAVILAKARIQVVTRAKRIVAALRAEGLRTGFRHSPE